MLAHVGILLSLMHMCAFWFLGRCANFKQRFLSVFPAKLEISKHCKMKLAHWNTKCRSERKKNDSIIHSLEFSIQDIRLMKYSTSNNNNKNEKNKYQQIWHNKIKSKCPENKSPNYKIKYLLLEMVI